MPLETISQAVQSLVIRKVFVDYLWALQKNPVNILEKPTEDPKGAGYLYCRDLFWKYLVVCTIRDGETQSSIPIIINMNSFLSFIPVFMAWGNIYYWKIAS